LNENNGQLRTRILTLGDTVKLQGFVDFVGLLIITSRTVDELSNLELLTSHIFLSKSCVVFSTKNLLELGCDECYNLNLMNFKFVKIPEF